MGKDKLESPRKGFQFFRDHAKSNEAFTLQELMDFTGWTDASIATYKSKQWPGLLEKDDAGKFRVRREFLRLSEHEFLDHISQKRPLFSKYERRMHSALLVFEFLIPLTRESQLRAALDELFFADTIAQRIHEIGVANMASLLPRIPAESDDEYVTRAVSFANKFYGYSVSHVAGRFRASSELLSRVDAVEHVAQGGRYLIDETTAVVRFILPLQTASREFSDSLFVPSDLDSDEAIDEAALAAEVHELRTMFFLFFVEAIVRTIKGEDEIWLLERGVKDRLYVWSRVAR